MTNHAFRFRPYIFSLMVSILCAGAYADDFALRDGDTVVLLGDSITAEGTWGKVLETYTLLRYPERKVRFVNAGWGGDTMTGSLKRLDRDVFNNQATVVIVAFGINDIGWGGKADEEHRKAYLDSTRELIRRCQERHVRVFLCSAATTGADPDQSENDYLQKMCDEGMGIAKAMGESAIDIQRTMRGIQRRVKRYNENEKDEKKRESMHAGDGIHLTDLGETAMGFAVIKGLGGPAEVSAATVDFASGEVGKVSNCQVTEVQKTDGAIEFTRLDGGLPMNLGLFWGLKSRFIPFPEELNRYMLTVRNLPAGKYEIMAGGRALGSFTGEALGRGVNLGSATADPWVPGGPWDSQGWLVHSLTQSRFLLVTTRKAGPEYLKGNPNGGEIDAKTLEESERMEGLQRLMARPVGYRFVIRRVGEGGK